MKNKPDYPFTRSWKAVLPATCLLVLALTVCTINQGPVMDPTTTTSPTKLFNPYEISDGGFLSGEPCGPPCFLGITGEDDMESALLKLQGENALTEDCVVNENEILCGTYMVYFPTSEENGTAIGVTFFPENITLSEVIEKYEEPDDVWCEYPVDDSGYWEGYSELNICYSEYNAVITFEQQRPGDYFYEALPTVEVFLVGYQYGSEYSCSDTGIQEWHGYGIYENP